MYLALLTIDSTFCFAVQSYFCTDLIVLEDFDLHPIPLIYEPIFFELLSRCEHHFHYHYETLIFPELVRCLISKPLRMIIQKKAAEAAFFLLFNKNYIRWHSALNFEKLINSISSIKITTDNTANCSHNDA